MDKRRKGLLTELNPEHWAAAKQYFKENNDAVKLSAKDSDRPYSFIKVGDEIYAINRNKYLGEGSFGKVKTCQNQKGENFAVKIEGTTLDAEQSAESKIMRFLGTLVGTAYRQREGEAKGVLKKFESGSFYNPATRDRLYTVSELIEGDNLETELYKGLLSDEGYQKYAHNIAFNAAKQINELHKHGIIHNDIKPQNFMINMRGRLVTITPIDFGLSIILPEGQDSVILDEAMGTFRSPEIKSEHRYSMASDIYALGEMFVNDFFLKDEIFERMRAKDPADRPALEEVIAYLDPTLSEELIEAVTTQNLPFLEETLQTWVPTKIDSENNTLLHLAVAQNGENAVAMMNLLVNTPNATSIFNSYNEKGDCPLHIAIRGKNIEMVKILINHGADVMLMNDFGELPLDLAEDTDIPELFDLIQQALNPEQVLTNKQEEELVADPPRRNRDFLKDKVTTEQVLTQTQDKKEKSRKPT